TVPLPNISCTRLKSNAPTRPQLMPPMITRIAATRSSGLLFTFPPLGSRRARRDSDRARRTFLPRLYFAAPLKVRALADVMRTEGLEPPRDRSHQDLNFVERCYPIPTWLVQRVSCYLLLPGSTPYWNQIGTKIKSPLSRIAPRPFRLRFLLARMK